MDLGTAMKCVFNFFHQREQLESHMKRHKASYKKKIIIDSEIAEQLKVIKWPTFMDILPIALARGILSFILGIPTSFGSLKSILCVFLEKAKKEWEEKRGTSLFMCASEVL